MDRLFDVIFVRPPSDSYGHCVSTNPARNTIDVTLAKRQHKGYVSALREAGTIQVIELPALQALPDSVFLTDAAILGVGSCILGRFGKPSRRDENEVLANELSAFSQVGDMRRIIAPGTLEGGDVLVTEDEMFVGNQVGTESPRTNLEGIRQLASLTKRKVTQVRSKTFHLLCACSFLRGKELLLAPDVLSTDSFPGFTFVHVPSDELYAAEALYLGNGRVMVAAGYPKTVKNLKRGGYSPVEVELSEFQKGDGGISCLSAPVYKKI
jgi:dimethylargininase